jgi:hypothetical protein
MSYLHINLSFESLYLLKKTTSKSVKCGSFKDTKEKTAGIDFVLYVMKTKPFCKIIVLQMLAAC